MCKFQLLYYLLYGMGIRADHFLFCGDIVVHGGGDGGLRSDTIVALLSDQGVRGGLFRDGVCWYGP